jgi:hypothetical protein
MQVGLHQVRRGGQRTAIDIVDEYRDCEQQDDRTARGARSIQRRRDAGVQLA